MNELDKLETLCMYLQVAQSMSMFIEIIKLMKDVSSPDEYQSWKIGVAHQILTLVGVFDLPSKDEWDIGII